MSTSYYNRPGATHLDGTPIFATPEDRQAEHHIAELIADAWDCQIQPFGPLSPIDFYATRHGRLVGVLELKTRSHSRNRYPTVFLNVRKWLALNLAGIGLGVPAMFIVQWADGVGFVNVSCVDGARHVIGGCSRRVKSATDVEPVIEVPVSEFKPLRGPA